MERDILKPKSGLFWNRGWKIWRYWEDVKEYFARRKFLLKHGYPVSTHWCFDTVFCQMMKESLEYYRKYAMGYPTCFGKTEEESHRKWYEILDRMMVLLEYMDESSPIYDKIHGEEQWNMRENAKEEFMGLFGKTLFHLWD